MGKSLTLGHRRGFAKNLGRLKGRKHDSKRKSVWWSGQSIPRNQQDIFHKGLPRFEMWHESLLYLLPHISYPSSHSHKPHIVHHPFTETCLHAARYLVTHAWNHQSNIHRRTMGCDERDANFREESVPHSSLAHYPYRPAEVRLGHISCYAREVVILPSRYGSRFGEAKLRSKPS